MCGWANCTGQLARSPKVLLGGVELEANGVGKLPASGEGQHTVEAQPSSAVQQLRPRLCGATGVLLGRGQQLRPRPRPAQPAAAARRGTVNTHSMCWPAALQGRTALSVSCIACRPQSLPTTSSALHTNSKASPEDPTIVCSLVAALAIALVPRPPRHVAAEEALAAAHEGQRGARH